MNFNLRARLTGKGGNDSGDGKKKGDEVEGAEADEEAVREEKFLSKVLEVTRGMYFEKKLVGSIYACRSFAFYSSSLNCDVDSTAPIEEEETEIRESTGNEQMSFFERKVVTGVKGAISTMQRRAKAYKNKPYRKDLTLSCGLSVSDPFLGLISTSITCSATVASLLAEEDENIEQTSC
jgi:hypothetical protein